MTPCFRTQSPIDGNRSTLPARHLARSEQPMSTQPRTLFDKVWAAHEIVCREDGDALMWVDRHFIHEGSFHAFDMLRERGSAVARPDLTFAVADHYVPTRGRDRGIADPAIARMVERLDANTAAHWIKMFG